MARVYLGRIPYSARERDVEKFFSGYGKIRDISMKYGFAFVEFDDERDAEDAVHDLNGKSMNSDSNLRCIVEIARGRPRGSDEYRYRTDGGRGDRGGRDGRRRSRSKSRDRRRRSRDRRRSPKRSRSPKRRSRRDSGSKSRDRSEDRSRSPVPKKSKRSQSGSKSPSPKKSKRDVSRSVSASPRKDKRKASRSVSSSLPSRNPTVSPHPIDDFSPKSPPPSRYTPEGFGYPDTPSPKRERSGESEHAPKHNDNASSGSGTPDNQRSPASSRSDSLKKNGKHHSSKSRSASPVDN